MIPASTTLTDVEKEDEIEFVMLLRYIYMMKITRERFMLFVLAMVIVAGLLAWQIPAGKPGSNSADIEYLIITSILIMISVRFEAFTVALAIGYGSSLLFCFFYLFIAPFEAPIMLALFFIPALLWQKKRIGCLQLGLAGAILVWLSWKILDRPAILVLLMPTCQILAIRMTSSVHNRYSREERDAGTNLSLRQRQQIRGKDLNLENDWWEIIRPEVEAFPERIKELWRDYTGESPHRHLGDDSVLDLDLLQLQNAAIMSGALTSIKKRDEKFATDMFLKRVEQTFWKIQNSCYSQKLEPVQSLISDALFEQFLCQVEEQKAAGIRYKHNRMTIYDTRLAQVNCDNSFDVIHVFIRASSADAIIDLSSGETIAENEEKRKFCEYWTFIRRPSAKTLSHAGLLEGSCPNCSTPLQIGQSTVCPTCRSYIRSGFYDWVLSQITQACEWEYYEPSRIPDWRNLKAIDPDFTLHQIEDRSSVIFWMLRRAERSGSVEPIQRFATEAFCHYYSLDKSDKDFNYMENINLASVTVKGLKLTRFWDSIFILLVWSGIPTRLDKNGKVIEERRSSRIMREVMILGRRHGVKTSQNNTLSSAHCPACGGPLTSTFAIACSYCNSILNEGSNSWILEKMTNEEDPAYQEILKKKPEHTADSEEDEATRSARDVITVMAQLLLADGKVEVSEMTLLEKIAERYGMPEADLNLIVWSLKQGQIYIPAPADVKEAWSLLQAAARMALADDQLSPEEEYSLNILAQHLGYSQADVQRAIKAEEKRRFSESKKAAYEAAKARLYG
jgi:uncharacterized Zn finger protein (UPF0148 family)